MLGRYEVSRRRRHLAHVGDEGGGDAEVDDGDVMDDGGDDEDLLRRG